MDSRFVRRLAGRPAWQYASAVVLVLAATLARVPFEGYLQGRAPYATYYVAILLVGWFFGPGPTVLAAGLSFVSAWYFVVSPRHSFVIDDPRDAASLLLFLAVGGTMVILSNLARVLRARTLSTLESAQRAQRIARAAAWSWDLKHTLGGADEIATLLGLREQDLRTLHDAGASIHPDDRKRYERAIEAALESDGKLDLEYRIAHPALGERWISTIGQVQRDNDGRRIGISGMTVDVTERRLAESAKARLAAIVESSEDAIISKTL